MELFDGIDQRLKSALDIARVLESDHGVVRPSILKGHVQGILTDDSPSGRQGTKWMKTRMTIGQQELRLNLVTIGTNPKRIAGELDPDSLASVKLTTGFNLDIRSADTTCHLGKLMVLNDLIISTHDTEDGIVVISGVCKELAGRCKLIGVISRDIDRTLGNSPVELG
jgi:hypothetical protein